MRPLFTPEETPSPPEAPDQNVIDELTGGETPPASPPSGGWQPMKIKAAGEEVEVKSLEEAVALMQKGADYHKKTQTLAEERRDLEQKVQIAEAAEAYKEEATPENLRQYYSLLGYDKDFIDANIKAIFGDQNKDDQNVNTNTAQSDDSIKSLEERIDEQNRTIERLSELINSGENYRIDTEIHQALTKHPQLGKFLKSLPEEFAGEWNKQFQEMGETALREKLKGSKYEPGNASMIAQEVVDHISKAAAKQGLFNPKIFLGGGQGGTAPPEPPSLKKHPDLNDPKTTVTDLKSQLRKEFDFLRARAESQGD